MDIAKYPGSMHLEETGIPGTPAIIFIHGAGQSSREWRGHMARLSDFHCLAPDLPGFGRSNRLAPASREGMADLLAELVEGQVPAKRASFVGVSSAGMVIHSLLDRHPDLVERVIIDGSPPYDASRAGRALMRLFTAALSPFIHTRPVLALFRDTHDPADLRATSRRAFRSALAECFLTCATIGAPCPTLLVAGEKESRVRPTNATLAALLPRAEAWYAPGLDHCWQRVAPDLHIRMVAAWVGGHEMPPGLRPEPAPSPEAIERMRRKVGQRDVMHVEESGAPGAPAIVFLHGGGQSSREWRGHRDRLSGFHCLAPDLPGHGRSNHLPTGSPGEVADLVAELIETRVPAGRASVVGVSWAGAIIHALLDRHPDLVDRAIVDGSPPFLAPRGAAPLMALFLTVLSPFLHTRPVMALFRETHDPADLRATSRRAFRRSITDSLHATAATVAPCPVLLVAGEKEGYVRPADAALAAIMPHAEARYAPGLDHCWQRVAPDLHIAMVEAWVKGRELPSELQREPAPSPQMVERVRRMAPGNWYLQRRSRIMREVRFASRPYRKLFVSTYGKEAGEAVATDAMRRFEALLPDIPYIGGDENPMTRTLYLSAVWLAMYRALRARGASVDEAARLIYLGTVSLYDSFPFRLLLRWQGRRLFGREHIEQRRHAAAISQRRRYPDDWVYDVVDGDGQGFEWGLDYTECAIVKYLRREGAPELAAYGCWVDYPAYAAMGVKLIRTETIAQGGRRCDFRFSRGKPVEVEPEFLHV